MRTWRPQIASVFAALFIGGVSLNYAVGKPEIQTLPTIDILQLIVTGMCMAAVLISVVSLLRGPRYDAQKSGDSIATAMRRIVIVRTPVPARRSARRLSTRLGLPHVELDSIYHQPGWAPLPADEFRAG